MHTPIGLVAGRCRGRLCTSPHLSHHPLQQNPWLVLVAVLPLPTPRGRLACGLPASSALSDTQRSSTPCSGTGRSGATLAWCTRRWRTLAWNHSSPEVAGLWCGGGQVVVVGSKAKSANAHATRHDIGGATRKQEWVEGGGWLWRGLMARTDGQGGPTTCSMRGIEGTLAKSAKTKERAQHGL
jgi:hypothetical protein